MSKKYSSCEGVEDSEKQENRPRRKDKMKRLICEAVEEKAGASVQILNLFSPLIYVYFLHKVINNQENI